MEKKNNGNQLQESLIDELRARRTANQATLAKLALRGELLDEHIEKGEQAASSLLPVTVSANSYKWEDGGYIGGYREQYKREPLHLECSDLSLAYIFALARLPRSLGANTGKELAESLDSEQREKKTRDFTDVSLVEVKIEEEWEKPPAKLMEVWQTAKQRGRERLALLLDEVIETNPYKAIPIRINKLSLYDALLRQKITELIEASDEIKRSVPLEEE